MVKIQFEGSVSGAHYNRLLRTSKGLWLCGVLFSSSPCPADVPQTTLSGPCQASQPDVPGTASGKKTAPASNAQLSAVGPDKTLHAHGSIQALSFSPDGRIIAAATGNARDKATKTTAKVYLWHVTTSALVRTLEIKNSPLATSVAFSPKGKTVASADFSPTATVWDATSGRLVSTVNTPGWPLIRGITYSPNGAMLAAASAGGGEGENNLVTLWSLPNSKLIRGLRGPAYATVFSVAFSPNSKMVAAGCGWNDLGKDYGAVYLYDLSKPTQKSLIAQRNSIVLGVFFVQKGHVLAIGRPDGVYLTSPSTGRVLRVIATKGGVISSLAFSSDGKLVALNRSRSPKIEIWDIQRAKMVRSLTQARGVLCLAFSPDGTRVASGSVNGSIRLWNL